MLGCENLIVAVDHKPLLKLLADRAIDDISNPRLRNLKEKILSYCSRITHVPGMKNKAADAMSRRPVSSALSSRMNLPDDNAAIVNHIPLIMHTDVLSLLRQIEQDDDDDYIEEDNLTWCAAGLESLRSLTWDRVREATSSDVNMYTLEEMATDGIPDSKIEKPETIRDYHEYRKNITSTDGVILHKDRVIVPPSRRGEVLGTLHAAHQGISMMTARAESFWLGISADSSTTRKKLRTLPPDGTLTAWSTAHPTDPGGLPLPGCVLGLLCTQGRTLPRDGGQILKLANNITVDRWRHRYHQPLTSRVRDVRDARRARIGWVRSSPLPRPGLSCTDGAYTTTYHRWPSLIATVVQRLE